MAGPTTYYLDPSSAFSKDVWLPGAYEQLEDTPGLLFNMLDQQEPTRIEGRNMFFKLDIGDSLGQGIVAAQGGDFPSAIDSEWAEGKLTVARLAHTAELTMDEWEMLQNEPAAAVNVIEHKINKAVSKMTRELSRQSHGDGSAVLARCDTTTASNTVNLQTTDSNQYDRDRKNWLAPRRVYVDIVDSTNGSITASARLVTAMAKDGSTITVDGSAVTTDTDDVIVWHGSVDDGGASTYTSGEVIGLGQLMKEDRTWLGIDSSTAGNEYWDPVVVEGSTPGTPELFSLNRLQKLYVEMANHAHDGMQPSARSGHVLFSSHGVAATAIATIAGQIRYANPAGDAGPADFGFQEIEGLGLRWFTDVHYARNVLDALRIEGEYGIKFTRPANPMQGILDFVTTGSGDMWHLANATSGQGHAAKMLAYLTGLFGMCAKKPSEHGRLNDITELGAPA